MSALALLALCIAALPAGTVDAIVGGGGLIQLPVLLLFLPGGATIFSVATNKLAAVVGTVAVARRIEIDWRHTGPTAFGARSADAPGWRS